FALGVVGIDPSLVIHHPPERLALHHGEIADHGDQNVLDAFLVKRARQMMMVDDVVALVRSENHRDHMSAEKLALCFLRLVLLPVLAQALALFLHLPQSDSHLRRTQREDWNSMKDRFARIRHGLKPLVCVKMPVKLMRLWHDGTDDQMPLPA